MLLDVINPAVSQGANASASLCAMGMPAPNAAGQTSESRTGSLKTTDPALFRALLQSAVPTEGNEPPDGGKLPGATPGMTSRQLPLAETADAEVPVRVRIVGPKAMLPQTALQEAADPQAADPATTNAATANEAVANPEAVSSEGAELGVQLPSAAAATAAKVSEAAAAVTQVPEEDAPLEAIEPGAPKKPDSLKLERESSGVTSRKRAAEEHNSETTAKPSSTADASVAQSSLPGSAADYLRMIAVLEQSSSMSGLTDPSAQRQTKGVANAWSTEPNHDIRPVSVSPFQSVNSFEAVSSTHAGDALAVPEELGASRAQLKAPESAFAGPLPEVSEAVASADNDVPVAKPSLEGTMPEPPAEGQKQIAGDREEVTAAHAATSPVLTASAPPASPLAAAALRKPETAAVRGVTEMVATGEAKSVDQEDGRDGVLGAAEETLNRSSSGSTQVAKAVKPLPIQGSAQDGKLVSAQATSTAVTSHPEAEADKKATATAGTRKVPGTKSAAAKKLDDTHQAETRQPEIVPQQPGRSESQARVPLAATVATTATGGVSGTEVKSAATASVTTLQDGSADTRASGVAAAESRAATLPAEGKGHHLEVALQDASLGSIRIRAAMSGGEVNINLAAGSEQARAELADIQPLLHASVLQHAETQGSVATLHVSAGGNATMSEPEQRQSSSGSFGGTSPRGGQEQQPSREPHVNTAAYSERGERVPLNGMVASAMGAVSGPAANHGVFSVRI